MRERIHNLLNQLDRELLRFSAEGEALDMFLLGRASLVLSYDFPLATHDIDIVLASDSQLQRKAIEIAGEGTRLARSVGLYLDLVGVAPLPSGFRNRCTPLAGEWKVLQCWLLEAHDLAVSKLKSFRPQDREDLQMLCDRGLLQAERLRSSLEAAFPFRSPKPEDAEDDRDTPEWGKSLKSFKRVGPIWRGR